MIILIVYAKPGQMVITLHTKEKDVGSCQYKYKSQLFSENYLSTPVVGVCTWE